MASEQIGRGFWRAVSEDFIRTQGSKSFFGRSHLKLRFAFRAIALEVLLSPKSRAVPPAVTKPTRAFCSARESLVPLQQLVPTPMIRWLMVLRYRGVNLLARLKVVPGNW